MSEFKKTKEEIVFELIYCINVLIRLFLSIIVDYFIFLPFKFFVLRNLKSKSLSASDMDSGDYQFESPKDSHRLKYKIMIWLCKLSSRLLGIMPSYDAYPRLLIAPIGATIFCYRKQKTVFSYLIKGEVDSGGNRWVDFGWVATFKDKSKFKIIEHISFEGKPLKIKCMWIEGQDAGKDFLLKIRPDTYDEIGEFLSLNVIPPPGGLVHIVTICFLLWGIGEFILSLYK